MKLVWGEYVGWVFLRGTTERVGDGFLGPRAVQRLSKVG